MWATKIVALHIFLFILHPDCLRPVSGLYQYVAAEILRLRSSHAGPPPPGLLLHPDIVLPPRRGYTYRGTRRPPRSVNQSALAYPTRMANAPAGQQPSIAKFGLLNTRSLTNKGHHILDLLSDNNLDFLCLVETWQHPNDFSSLNDAAPQGYVYTSKSRGEAVSL
uniref:Endonuclease/exonuclease/phosphatase domain-containing protein n=1 Tax=Nothobranchius rachovii TaxID=451742 RepID=A0A1A8S1F5_9TELE